MLFWPKKVFWPKAEKEESRNTETETYFGLNFRPKLNANCFGLPTTSSSPQWLWVSEVVRCQVRLMSPISPHCNMRAHWTHRLARCMTFNAKRGDMPKSRFRLRGCFRPPNGLRGQIWPCHWLSHGQLPIHTKIHTSFQMVYLAGLASFWTFTD